MNDAIRYLLEASVFELLLLKATALLALGWLFHFALARGNPRWRVLLWRGVLIGLAVLPAFEFFAPSLEMALLAPPPVEMGQVGQEPTVLEQESSPGVMAAVSAAPPVRVSSEMATTAEEATFDWRGIAIQVAVGLYLFTALILLFRLLLRMKSLREFVKETEPAPQEVALLAEKVARDLGCNRDFTVRISPERISPFLTHLAFPTLVLPQGSLELHRRADLPGILAHELTHLQSNDLLWTLLAKAVSALCWIHPLVWRVPSAHNSACERVCDAAAAAYVGDPAAYSRTLARSALEVLTPSPTEGLPMIRKAEITRRLRSLKRGMRWGALSKKWVVPVVLLGICGLGLVGSMAVVEKEPEVTDETQVSTAEVEEETTGAVQGQVLIGGTPASGIRVTYSPFENNLDFIQPLRTDSEGRFQVGELPPGRYMFARASERTLKKEKSTDSQMMYTHGVYVDVVGGETQEITIGGSGLDLVGKFVPLTNEKGESVSPQAFHCFFGHNTPRDPDFEGNRPGIILLPQIEPDGTFTMVDAIPGEYQILIDYYDDTGRRELVCTPGTFTVPERTEDMNIPYNLDEFELDLWPIEKSDAWYAIWEGDLETLKARVTEVPDLINFRTNDGQTLLIAAATAGREEMITFLLEQGADINAQDEEGHNAWYHAAHNGHMEIANLLVREGSDWQTDEVGVEKGPEPLRKKRISDDPEPVDEGR